MKRARILMVAIVGLLATLGAAAARAATDTEGRTTVQQRILADSGSGFRYLHKGPGEGYTVRQDGVGAAKPGRAARRTSLAYFGQVSDFQLADEESPARVEFLDPLGAALTSAWRPGEALNPQIDDEMIRQVNAFAGAGPVADGRGAHPKMGFAIDTGDSTDNEQLNEARWVRTLLEGGELDPGSGESPSGYDSPFCPPHVSVPFADADPAAYTGVQDTGDFPSQYFYDPDDPAAQTGPFAGFPAYPGLMDRAQQPFHAAGLKVPSYVTFGNHDALLQGNLAATSTFEKVATGCVKPVADAGDPNLARLTNLALEGAETTDQDVLDLIDQEPEHVIGVPPDRDRRFVSKREYKQIFRDGAQKDGHGFGLIPESIERASGGSAGYYSFSPSPGLRMIALDTISEAGKVLVSSEGNVDDPQYRWLEGQLADATARKQLVIIFSHHAIDNLTADVPDERAPPCTAADEHGHDVNPGCDLDPRASTPIHLGADMVALLHRYPDVIAWVSGHSHVNAIKPYPDGRGGGFWSVKVAAEADWPQQGRLLQLFDNHDGTLSLFGTIIDHAGPIVAPPAGSPASGMDEAGLASVGRTLSYNDNQTGARACAASPCGEGGPGDRNVELMITDPRAAEPEKKGPQVIVDPIWPAPKITRLRISPRKRHLRAGRKAKLTIKMTNRGNATAGKIRVRLRSSNRRVKIRRSIRIRRIAPGHTARVRVKIRAKRRARGRAKITARYKRRRGTSRIRIKARHRHRHRGRRHGNRHRHGHKHGHRKHHHGHRHSHKHGHHKHDHGR